MASGGGFDEIFAELTQLNAELVLISERVGMLEDALQSGGSGPGEQTKQRPPGAPVIWSELDDDDYHVLWPQFVAWVIWTADRYEVTTDQLPRQCWVLHGAVVDELTALWTSYQSAYAPGEDAGSAPYLWQQAFAAALDRFARNWLGTCRNGQHKERHRERWAGDAAYLETLLQAVRPTAAQSPPGSDHDAGSSSHE